MRDFLARTVQRDWNCVDVGASVGAVLAQLVSLAPDGKHVAFEPLPEFAERLRERFPAVEVHAAAVADAAGTATFAYVTERAATSGLRSEDGERITVAVETLDEALAGKPAPQLVKVDVEGAEILVLRGARQTLVAAKPILVYEHSAESAARYDGDPLAIHRLLADAAYEIRDIFGGGPYDADAYAAVVARGDAENFVALPAR
jgi:FkbM family methyltransferase